MNLFDRNPDSIGTRPKQYAEATFEYYNRSARKSIRKMACVLEKWFDLYPDSGKTDLRGRFRSVNENQHSSAVLELVLHELLSRLGYKIELHPQLAGNTVHPDFLASKNGMCSFFMEATAACEADAQAAKERRINQVYDTLNRLVSPDFFLGVESAGGPATPPPGARLRLELQQWLKTLDWALVKARGEQGGVFPEYTWEHDGWSIVIKAWPKKEEARGRPGVRPIGTTMPEVRWLSTDASIKRAVEGKDRYGSLPIPFVVVVNVRDDFCDTDDVFDALLGKQTIIATRVSARSGRRLPNGTWAGKSGPIHPNISAVLVFCDMVAATLANLQYWFVHNPWAARPLNSTMFPLRQYVPDIGRGEFEERVGISFGQALSLPEPWPPTED